MGDRTYSQPNELARQLVMNCLAHPALRSEVYAVICKQLTNNPDPSSVQKGWDLMLICLNSFRSVAHSDSSLCCVMQHLPFFCVLCSLLCVVFCVMQTWP
jgi:hypothetical protein